MSSSSTSLRPCSSAGTLPGSMSFSAEYNRHGFLSRLHLEQVNICSREGDSGHASLQTTVIVTQVFLEAMEGCQLSVMQTVIFRVSPSAIVQIFVSLGCKDGLPLISSSGVGVPSRLGSAVSFHSFRWAFALALQRCSFSADSQPDVLSSALLFPWSFRWTLWQLLVCVELRGSLPSARSFRWTVWQLPVCVQLRCALSSARWFRWTVWQLPVSVQLRGGLPSARWFCWTAASFGHFSPVRKGPPPLPFPTFFHKRFFRFFLSSYCLNLIKLTKFPATFARRWHKNPAKTAASPMPSVLPGQTKSDLERSALPATVLRTSPSPTSPDKQSPTSNIRPCPPRSSAPVPPRHPRTNKVRPRTPGPAATVLRTNLSRHSRTNKVRPRTFGPARHGPPHQSLPDIPGQTKSDLEHSALPATVLRTSPSPTSPDKQSPTSNAWPCRHGPPHQSLPTFPDKQSPTSNIRPCAPRSSASVPSRHPRTNKVRPRTFGPARHGPPHQSLPDIPGQTKSDLERLALPATVLRTSPFPTSPDKQSPTSNAWPCPPRSSAPVPSRHPRTNKVRPRTLGPARHGPPHQSLPDIPGQTKSDLEHSALPATVLRTSPSPTSPDKQSPTSNAWPCPPRSSAPISPRQNRTNKVRIRMLGAARLARTRVPNISPLTRGNYIWLVRAWPAIQCRPSKGPFQST